MKRKSPTAIFAAAVIMALTVTALLLTGCSAGTDRDYTGDTADSLPTSAGNEADTIASETTFIISTPEDARNFMRTSPDSARYAKGIIPRITDDCPDYGVRLLNSADDGFIIVDKGSMNVLLFDRFGIEIRCYPMACAKNYGTKHARRDGRTPEGFFKIKSIHDSTEWLFTDDDGNTSDVKGQFGPRFIRIDTPVSSQIGIHGTCAPWSIGGRRSHGCVRITNENILELVELVHTGMPVIINPGVRDEAVNEAEGYSIPVIFTGHARKGKKPAVIATAETPDSSDIAKPANNPDVENHPASDSLPILPSGNNDSLPTDSANVIFSKN